ncbi:hypothetical protein [Arthrobacter castelli]|uniref:hypothetical protein n=1 Tax=Arthrobacter castelli TaxID=271431 RepID=UPI00041D1B82|nr:hypothetical protein [Arthrobacter castelli]
MPLNAQPAGRRVVPLVPHETASGDDVLQVDGPFSASELQAMAHDGLLVHLCGATYLRAGARPGPQIRARAMAAELPAALRDRAVIGRQSALWIYTGGQVPAKINLLIDHRRRTSALRPFSGCQLHEVRLAADDAAAVGAAETAVTTPLRTAVDMALYAPEAESAAAVQALTSHPMLDCPLETVGARLESLVRVPRKRAALALVDALIAARDPATTTAVPGPANR